MSLDLFIIADSYNYIIIIINIIIRIVIIIDVIIIGVEQVILGYHRIAYNNIINNSS